MVRIEDGTCLALFAYDIGYGIDLVRASGLREADLARARLQHQRRAPAYLQFRAPPVRIDERIDACGVADAALDAHVEVTLYEFGAVSVCYRIPIGGRALQGLVPIAVGLYENEMLLADSRRRAAALLARLGDAVSRPQLSELVEDYVVFHLRKWQGAATPGAVVDQDPQTIARVLNAEPDPLSDGEVADALEYRIGYGVDDEAIIGWAGAIVFEAQGDDTLAVLEFANVELLEMRFLDDKLDTALDRAHETMRRDGERGVWRRAFRAPDQGLRRIALLQMDSALLFEGVNNAIKLLGDQYLARLYRLAATRFHLPDWDASILRKLETLESTYRKLADTSDRIRMEALEWIIIVLIAVSIAIPFIAGGGGH